MSDASLDLAAYLARIGYVGPAEPSLPVLRALIGRHSASIPFENIDVLLGRPIELGLGPLQRKLVAGGRGGYCFEQNSLLLAALRAIGFTARGLLGRVVRGAPADAERPRTHMTLLVDLPEGPVLADVGFGNLTPTAPLMLVPERVQETMHERYRLLPMGPDLLLQAEVDGEWGNVYRFSLEQQTPIDFEMGNWFTWTRPESLFRNNLICARPEPDKRVTLFNGWIGERGAAGAADRTPLNAEQAYRAALVGRLGLRLTDDELAAIATAAQAFAARQDTHPAF